MASKRRIRRNKCEGKVCHETRTDAISAAIALRKVERKPGWQAQAYHCKFCGGFHVGHGGPLTGGKW